jgi:hypothetical protein
MHQGLLIAGFDFSEASAEEFHDWYDLEHVPEREAVQGFGTCARWLDEANDTRAIATYDLDTMNVLDSDAYLAIAYDNLSPWSKRVTGKCARLIRFEGEHIGPPATAPARSAVGAVLLNAMNIAPENEADFNAWYDEEHLPALCAVAGTLSARRYVGRAGTHRYVALYQLENASVTRSDAWRAAVDTPWTKKVRPYFQDHLRMVAKAYQRKD